MLAFVVTSPAAGFFASTISRAFAFAYENTKSPHSFSRPLSSSPTSSPPSSGPWTAQGGPSRSLGCFGSWQSRSAWWRL
jgi:hypothetical protein